MRSSRFRSRLSRALRRRSTDDPLYEAVSAGRLYAGHGALAAALPRAAGDAVRLLRRAPRSRSTTRPTRRIDARFDADRRLLRGARSTIAEAEAAMGAALPAAAAGAALSAASRVGRACSSDRAVALLSPFAARRRARRASSTPAAARAAISPSAGAARTSTSSTPCAIISPPSSRAASARSSPATRPAASTAWRICLATTASIASTAVAALVGRCGAGARRCGPAGAAASTHGFSPATSPSSPRPTSSATACAARRKTRKRSDQFLAELANFAEGDLRRPCRPWHRPLRRPGHARGRRRAARLPAHPL